MKSNKPLIKTNKFLRNKKLREILLVGHAVASASIEGVSNSRGIAGELSRTQSGGKSGNGIRSSSAKRKAKRS